MNAFKLIKIMKKYEKCNECGSNKVGNGMGKLIVENELFIRECKCGWKVKVNEEGKIIK